MIDLNWYKRALIEKARKAYSQGLISEKTFTEAIPDLACITSREEYNDYYKKLAICILDKL